MLRKWLCFSCLLSVSLLSACGEDNEDQGLPSGNNANKCQCQNSSCENCSTVVASCEDDTHIKIITKIDGYDGSKHIINTTDNTKQCLTGPCEQDNDTGAHCSNSSGN